MGTRHTIQKKHEWIQKELQIAKQTNTILSLKKLIAHFCIDNLCEERTAKAILKLYKDAGKIDLLGDDLKVL